MSFLSVAERLGKGHTKADHYAAFTGVDAADKKAGRIQFNTEVDMLAAWHPPRPTEWPLDRERDAALDDSDGEPVPIFALAKAVAKAVAKATPKAKAAAKASVGPSGAMRIARPKSLGLKTVAKKTAG